jgi:perosamine synthetase
MHEQPALRERGLFAGAHYPVTERLSRRGLYLPSGLALDDAQIETVCAAVRKCLA